MPTGVAESVIWVTIFTVLGALLGIAFLIICAVMVPRIVARMTPAIDEEKELVRGNMAVAEYYGRVVAATILGASIIIAAAIIAGIHG